MKSVRKTTERTRWGAGKSASDWPMNQTTYGTSKARPR